MDSSIHRIVPPGSRLRPAPSDRRRQPERDFVLPLEEEEERTRSSSSPGLARSAATSPFRECPSPTRLARTSTSEAEHHGKSHPEEPGRPARREPWGRRTRAVQEGGRAEVRAVSENGVVRAIEVVCACGDRMTIQLDVAPEEGASPR